MEHEHSIAISRQEAIEQVSATILPHIIRAFPDELTRPEVISNKAVEVATVFVDKLMAQREAVLAKLDE